MVIRRRDVIIHLTRHSNAPTRRAPPTSRPIEIRSAQVLPRNFLRPCLLLLLREQRAHGYDLLERLGALGFGRGDAGGRYRVLRQLETEGLVRSVWEKSSGGPDRRTYELTRAGIETLHCAATEMLLTRGVLDAFLGRYSEFVALEADHQ